MKGGGWAGVVGGGALGFTLGSLARHGVNEARLTPRKVKKSQKNTNEIKKLA
jgi:hypothetical protein